MTDKEPGNKKEKAALDPEKFFNEKEYNTIKIGDTGPKETDATVQLLELLGSKTIGEKDAALLALKKENAAGVLIEAIKNTKNSKDKAILLAACWESGIDLKDHLGFFATMAHDEDLFVSMEAITALSENITDVKPEEAKKLIVKLEHDLNDHFNAAFIQDVIERLKQLP